MKHLVFGFAAILCLGSCNTFIGMGRDIGQFGEGMENVSKGNKWNGDSSVPEDNLPTY